MTNVIYKKPFKEVIVSKYLFFFVLTVLNEWNESDHSSINIANFYGSVHNSQRIGQIRMKLI